MRILVTGVTGFAGGHLAEALLASGDVQLSGLSRRAEWPAEWRHLAAAVPLQRCDLCDLAAVEALLRDFQPEQIYHLAGYAYVGRSVREADAAWAGNLTATRTLYEAIARWGGRPRILYVGSGLVYGDAEGAEQAFDERAVLRPGTPYAASKAAADLAGFQYTRVPGLDIVRARPFNHIGPRQSPEFAVASFARQLALCERGQQPPVLETGNLSPRRDLSDVRDVVRAYLLLMAKGRTGEAYNIGSGEARSIQSVLDYLLRMARVRVEIRQRADLIRAAETHAVCADASKLRRETGWTPAYSFEQTLTDILEYWRS